MNFDQPVKNSIMLNEHIKSPRVRIVKDDGEQVGVMSTSEALSKARQANLDLVVINDKAEPPVCKITDSGKYRYELSKREKEAARKARDSRVVLKEIQLRLVTDKNDISIKARKAKEFLQEGNKVRIVVKFKGREVTHPDLGFSLMQNMLEQIGEHRIEKPSAMNGRDMVTILAPIPVTK